MFFPVERSMTVSAPHFVAHRSFSTSSSIDDVTAELPMFALIFTRKLRPMIIGSLSGWLTLAGMIARPRATSLRTNSGSTFSRIATKRITVTARLRGFPAVAPATAALLILHPWAPSDPIDVRLVPGGGWPNALAIEAVPNVLFLPDGFPAEWEEDFYSYVNRLVQFLKTDTV